MGMQNSASQQVQGLSHFIKQINQSKRSQNQVNKSIEYLRKQQRLTGGAKGASQPPRGKALKKASKEQQPSTSMGQNEFKQSLMLEIRHL